MVDNFFQAKSSLGLALAAGFLLSLSGARLSSERYDLLGLVILCFAALSALAYCRFLPRFLTVFLFCLVVGALLGGWRFSMVQVAGDFDELLEKKVTLRARVVAEPAGGDTGTRLVLAPECCRGRIIATTGRFPTYRLGDELEVAGVLRPPLAATSSGHSTYADYLAGQGIFYDLSFPTIKKLGYTPSLSSRLIALKNFLVERLNRHLPEPASSLAAGLLLGERRGLGRDWAEAFTRTGVSHVLAVSGYNVTVVAIAVLFFVSSLPAFWAGTLTLLAILFFVLLIGGAAPVWRAGGMALVAIYGRMIGRHYQALPALVVVAALMAAVNPLWLTDSLSFQLSFLATVGVIWIAPRLENFLAFLTNRFYFRQTVALTLGAQLAVLPLLLYATGSLSVVSLPANLIIVPLVPLAMATSALALAAGLIYPPLGSLLGALAYLPLSVQLGVVDFLNRPAWAAVNVSFGLWPTLIFYFFLLLWLVRGQQPPTAEIFPELKSFHDSSARF